MSCLCCSPTTPMLPKQHRFGLFRFRSPLLTESLLFSSPMGTEMFQFPTFAPFTWWQAFNLPGCPIRKSRDYGLFAPPPCLSQLITSFFASESLGIHRLPLSYFLPFVNRYRFTGRYIFSSTSIALFCFFVFVHHVKELVWKNRISSSPIQL